MTNFQAELKKKKSILNSFRAAFRGTGDLLRTEPTFKYFLAAFIAVIAAVLYFEPTRAESAVLIFVAIAVLALELVNSLFERMLDIVQPDRDERVRHIKDIMAGLVLLASIGAVIIGFIILFPYFMKLFGR